MMRQPSGTCCAACASTRKVPRKLVAITLSKAATSPLAIGKRHDARTVNHHIGSAESVHRLFEKPLHVFGICHICLHSDALSACSLEICDNCLCWGRFSRVVHDHRKSIFSQSFCDRASDSTRGARHERCLCHKPFPLSSDTGPCVIHPAHEFTMGF